MKEPTVDEINAIVDGYRRSCPYGKGQTKFLFIRKGKVFGSCVMLGSGRDMDYIAMTLAEKHSCKVKIARKVTYI